MKRSWAELLEEGEQQRQRTQGGNTIACFWNRGFSVSECREQGMVRGQKGLQGQITLGLAGHSKEFRIYCKFKGKSIKDFLKIFF